MKREKDFLKTGQMQSWMFLILISLSFLFLLQSSRELIASIYYHSLVEMGIHTTILLIAVFTAPLLTTPLLKYLGWRGGWLLSGTLLALSRFPMSLGLEQPYHMISAALALVGSSVFITTSLAIYRRERSLDPKVFSSQSLTASFVLALISQMALITLGRGYDISVVPEAMGVLLSPSIGALLVISFSFMLYVMRGSLVIGNSRAGEGEVGEEITGGLADSIMPALGLGFFLVAASTVLTHPGFVSGWAGVRYQVSLSVSLLSSGIFMMSLITNWRTLIALRRAFSSPKGAIIGNILLIASGVNIVFLGYDLYFTPMLFIWLALVDLWVILDALTDTEPFAGEPIEIEREDGEKKVLGFPGKKGRGSMPGTFSRGMTISLLILMAIAILSTLAVSWAHIPGGSLFEGALPWITIGGFAGLGVFGFSCSKARMDEPLLDQVREVEMKKGSPALDAGSGSGHIHKGGDVPSRSRTITLVLGSAALVFIITSSLSSMFLYTEPAPYEAGPDSEITVMTYNIHQGFNNDGRPDPTAVLEMIEGEDPDILLLQESEGLRLDTGMTDPVHYIASSLNMNYIRGPFTGEGIYGVSIITRFDPEEPKVHFLDSEEDKRVAVSCRIDVDDRSINLISTHIGLSDRDRRVQIRQLAAILENMEGNIIVGGDFNSEPGEKFMGPMNESFFGPGDENVSRGSGLSLISAYHAATGDGPGEEEHTFPASELNEERKHIDYVLVSRGIEVTDAGIGKGTKASDHRPVWADIVI